MRTLPLVAATIFYEQRESLRRTFESLKDFDLVVAVDGNLVDYPATNDLSSDGSRKLVKLYRNVCLLDRPNLTEEAKRNCYLPYGDPILVVDSDCWVYGDIDLFKRNLPAEPGIYCVKAVNFEGQHHPCPWLIVKPQNFEYYGAHCIMKNKATGEIFRLRGSYERLVKGITVRYDDRLRTREYMTAREVFKIRQLVHERPARDRYH